MISLDDHDDEVSLDRKIRGYLEIVGENHCNIVHVDVALLLNGECTLRPPAGDGVHIRKGVE